MIEDNREVTVKPVAILFDKVCATFPRSGRPHDDWALREFNSLGGPGEAQRGAASIRCVAEADFRRSWDIL